MKHGLKNIKFNISQASLFAFTPKTRLSDSYSPALRRKYPVCQMLNFDLHQNAASTFKKRDELNAEYAEKGVEIQFMFEEIS